MATVNLTNTYDTNASTDNGIAVQYDLGALTGTRTISNFLAFSTDAINNLIDAGLVVSETDITVGEDGTTATFTVQLQDAPTSNVVLDLSSSDTTEATLSANSLTFTPANWNTPQTVTVSASNDNIADGDQTSVITIRVNDASSDNNFDGLSKTINVTTTDLLNEDPNPAPTQTTNWNFVTRDYNLDGNTDIVAIQKSDTGTGTTEVHIMDAATNYQSWLLQTGTVLHETDDTWGFVKGDCNRDGATDILSIHKSGTGSGTTEVHIMDAATNYQSWVFQTGTALHETGDNWDFQAADYNRDGATDIIGIKKSDTGSGSTEIHILDGATNYQSFLLHTGTALHETGDNWAFQVGEYNNDGITDIVAVKKSDTGTATTEVHVLNGANNYQSFLFQTGTALAQTGDNWDFVMDDYNSNNSRGIISLKESDTGTGTTEAHILNAGANYQSWLLQTGSALPEIAPSSVV